MLVRLFVAIQFSRKLRRIAVAPGKLILTQAKRCASELALRSQPLVQCCEQVTGPLVVGVLRPAVLLPVAVVSKLSTEQIEAVIRHEFAHFKRFDHIAIVIQRGIESVLFFHPTTWYLSRQIHEFRELACDDLVIQSGADRLGYVTTLLKVAELRSSLATQLTAVAMDGNEPSKLRRRVSRLLGESVPQPTGTSSHLLPIAIAGLLLASLMSVSAKETPAAPVPQDKILFGEVQNLSGSARATLGSIKTAHLRYRMIRYGGQNAFRKGLSLADCEELLAKYDLAENPDKLRDLLVELSPADKKIATKPGNTVDLYSDGKHLRTSSSWAHKALDGKIVTVNDVHITDDKLSIRWDGENYQVDIQPINQNRRGQTRLRDFFQVLPPMREPPVEKFITSIGDGFIDLKVPQNHFKVDSKSGFVIQQSRSDRSTFRQGWKTSPRKIPYPVVVAEFAMRGGELNFIEIMLVEKAEFNQKLPDGIFTLGAPAASNIIDRRSEQVFYRLNRDVENVLDVDEVKAAAKQPASELTPSESTKLASLKEIYTLADGEDFKHIPEDSKSRQLVGRLLGNNAAIRTDRPFSRLLVIEKDGQLNHEFSYNGGYLPISSLLMRMNRLNSNQLEGDQKLLARQIQGDFIFRRGASADSVHAAVEKLIAEETGKATKIDFQEVERPAYVVTGTFKLNLGTSKQINIQSSPVAGNQYYDSVSTGTPDRFLSELSAYVKTQIVNEATFPNEEKSFKWVVRNYMMNRIKPADGFKFDVDLVLEGITEQTGLVFKKETRPLRVLRVNSGE